MRHLAQHVIWLLLGGMTAFGSLSPGRGLVVLPAVFVVLLVVVAIGLAVPRYGDAIAHGSSGILAGFFLGVGSTLALPVLARLSCPPREAGCQVGLDPTGLLFGIGSVALGLGLLAVLVLDERAPKEEKPTDGRRSTG